MRLGVIPARGGSKRIPGKNIKPFSGKPIIAYSIEAALEARLFDKVIVSTDDEEIASIAKKFGADIPFLRPAELSDDYTGTNSVVKHSIEWFNKQGSPVKYACCIYATAPFIKKKYLIEGFNLLINKGKNFVFSVSSFPSPIQRALRITNEGYIEAIYPENNFVRSQDLEEVYHDAGQFYWGTAEAFLNEEILYSSTSMPVILPRYLVQDIDTLEDWSRAEYMYQAISLAK